MTYKVVAVYPESCTVMSEIGEITQQVAFKQTTTSLAVGDLIELSSNIPNYVTKIFHRKTYLSRSRFDATRKNHHSEEQILGANIDFVGIVCSVVDPPFHPKLIDRYLIAANLGQATPIIILNKIDLCPELPQSLKIYKKIGVQVFPVSAVTKLGFDLLNNCLKGKTTIFTGHSGVGKTSILNNLIGAEYKTTAVSDKTRKGRHTTTVSTLYQVLGNTFVIDTPGIRSFGLYGIYRKDLQLYFQEFEPYLGHCKFNNCLHNEEPGCAIKIAVENHTIFEERYQSYLILLDELEQ